MKIKVGISNRHVHLSKEDLQLLFGKNFELEKLRDLTQKSDFCSKQTVDLINGDKRIDNVRVVGPCRTNTQVEITKTEAKVLGINPPRRNSSDLENASKITIQGPISKIKRNCVIIANRHIHMSEADALKLGYKNNDIVRVKLYGEKGGILDNVYVKISKDYQLELHIDVDDANTYLVKKGDYAEILEKIQ